METGVRDIRHIKVLALDVDGVLTDGRVAYTPDGEETKSLSYRDMDAVSAALRQGLKVVLVTGEDTPWVDFVAQRLRADRVIRGAKDKLEAVQGLAADMSVEPGEICYVGDGDRDAPALKYVGLGIAPADATRLAKESARVVLRSKGGDGAVREVMEVISRGAAPVFTPAAEPLEPGAREAKVRASIEESIAVKERVLEQMVPEIAGAAEMLCRAVGDGHRVLVFGNGGSAADAQHLAAELVGRFERERGPLPVLALTTDTSILTAVGNDYGEDRIFARQVEAFGGAGDVAIAISTSGNSPNVMAAIRAAHELGMSVIGMTGGDGGRMNDLVDLCLCVPSKRTARIQEVHVLIIHALCELLEAEAPPS